MANLLLEIGTEEIPAKFMPPALKELKDIAIKSFGENRLDYQEIDTYGTPRRIVLYVKGLADIQKDLVDEVRGPSVKVAFDVTGNPTKAAMGFARGQRVDASELIVKENYVYALKKETGRKAFEVLKEILPNLIMGIHFPKPMRWGDYEIKYARPIRWLVSLLDQEIIPVEIEGIVKSDRISRGHRFLGSDNIVIDKADDYFSLMKNNYVIIDPSERKDIILKEIKDLADSIDGEVARDEDLLEEVVHLVEYPTALMGGFSEDYLELPKEVIITPMKEHQRYFPILAKDGSLLPKFITVRNGDDQHLEIVQEGNEKVLKARLDDAKFFYDEDRKIKLEDYVEKLKAVVFQADLGTIYEKVERLEKGVKSLADALGIEEATTQRALRAAYLSKADLETNMVYEFTELQGIMGEKYALLSGEDPLVSKAIFEHYLPRNAEDALPETLEGTLVSIVDKMDTIAGCFLVGIEPTGSQDPYALRRQALGVCKILINKNLHISLKDLIAGAIDNYADKLDIAKKRKEIAQKIYEFFEMRVRNILDEAKYRYDLIEAVIASGYEYVNEVLLRAQAIDQLKGTDDFVKLTTAFTRANNLSKKAVSLEVEEKYLVEEVEKVLFGKLQETKENLKQVLVERNYSQALKIISELEEPISAFFEGVMVMDKDENIKNNRLALLKQVVLLVKPIADLSKLV